MKSIKKSSKYSKKLSKILKLYLTVISLIESYLLPNNTINMKELQLDSSQYQPSQFNNKLKWKDERVFKNEEDRNSTDIRSPESGTFGKVNSVVIEITLIT